jgi:GPH family glycoside/pentoside/hexuronide:cation symporter
MLGERRAHETSIAAEALPSIRLDVSYSLVLLGSPMLWSFVDSWLLYFYLPPAGQGVPRVPAALYGLAVFLPRILNALLTAPIGYLSDNTRSRWGRRLPYMFVSAAPLLIFFVLLWGPPNPGESIWNLVYLSIVLLLYNVAYSFLLIPYNSLLPEIALTDRHRVRISAWSAGFQLVGIILAGLAGWLIESQGYQATAMIYAAAVLPLFYLPFLALRERPERQIPLTERLAFGKSIALTLRNRPFLVLIGAGVCYWMTTTFVIAVVPYIVTEICLLTPADTVYFYLPAVLVSLACYPMITWLANRLGKWRVLAGTALLAAIILPGLALIGPWWPAPLAVQGVIWVMLEAMAMAGLMVLTPAFTAEVIDYDEKLTGQRREGAYASAWILLDQVVNGLAAAMLPAILLLGRSQADPQGPLGVRIIGPLGGVLLLIAFGIFLHYPLRHWSARR